MDAGTQTSQSVLKKIRNMIDGDGNVDADGDNFEKGANCNISGIKASKLSQPDKGEQKIRINCFLSRRRRHSREAHKRNPQKIVLGPGRLR